MHLSKSHKSDKINAILVKRDKSAGMTSLWFGAASRRHIYAFVDIKMFGNEAFSSLLNDVVFIRKICTC